MAKFKVTVFESRSADVFIEAKTNEEAFEIAESRYDNNELFYGQITNDSSLVDIYVTRTPFEDTPNE